MSTAQAPHPGTVGQSATVPATVTVYGHSPLFYWWPVWLTGYVMALITLAGGIPVQLGTEATGFSTVVMHPSKNLGVIYTVVFVLVILMTNVAVRGIASLTVITAVIALTFIFAYFDVWDDILSLFERLALFMNLGFYVFFSTAVFALWAVAFFVYDRFDYWTFRPGQLVHHKLLGGGEQVYDTHGMAVTKLRDDMFRHWILGLGSGDLHISTTGARRDEFVVPNVLGIDAKLARIQMLVAMKPDQSATVTATAGEPG